MFVIIVFFSAPFIYLGFTIFCLTPVSWGVSVSFPELWVHPSKWGRGSCRRRRSDFKLLSRLSIACTRARLSIVRALVCTARVQRRVFRAGPLGALSLWKFREQ